MCSVTITAADIYFWAEGSPEWVGAMVDKILTAAQERCSIHMSEGLLRSEVPHD